MFRPCNVRIVHVDNDVVAAAVVVVIIDAIIVDVVIVVVIVIVEVGVVQNRREPGRGHSDRLVV